MTLKIERDVTRFKQIVRHKIRENLRKYVTHGEMIGRKGRDLVSIPVPHLDVPHFRYGKNKFGRRWPRRWRAGPARRPRRERRRRRARPATIPGGHILEVDVTLEELADSWARNSSCPASSPRATPTLPRKRPATTASAAPAPNRSATSSAPTRRRSSGRYRQRHLPCPTSPRVVPINEDKRYRSWTTTDQEPRTNAVMIYMMDVSGSMTDEQKEIVRTEAFWIDTWLQSQYDGVERRYIIHDAVAKEGRRRHLLSHPRKRRHAHQLGLQSVQPAHRRTNSRRPNGTSTASNSPTATTGAKTTAKPCVYRCSRRACCPT